MPDRNLVSGLGGKVIVGDRCNTKIVRLAIRKIAITLSIFGRSLPIFSQTWEMFRCNTYVILRKIKAFCHCHFYVWMPVVIYNCPIFVKVGGWSFTLLPSRHTKFGLNQLKTEKVSPQHILLLGAVTRPFLPAKWRCRRACLTAPSPRPLLKKIKIVGFCPNLLGNRPWPLLARYKSERDDMKLILN